LIELSFEINGRKVDSSNIGNALEGAMLKAVQASVTSKLASVRCPDHHSAPRITARGRSLDDLSFDVSGCCQKLIDLVKAKLE